MRNSNRLTRRQGLNCLFTMFSKNCYVAKRNTSDLGFLILDLGSWILDLGFLILDLGSWVLDLGFLILDLDP